MKLLEIVEENERLGANIWVAADAEHIGWANRACYSAGDTEGFKQKFDRLATIRGLLVIQLALFQYEG